MQTAIKIPLRSLNPTVVKDLQEKYPNAQMQLITEAGLPEEEVMNEDHFWEVIALLDWTKEGNDDAVIEPAVRYLSGLTAPSILSFYDLLSEKLYLLDGRDYARHSTSDDEGISSDLFLYGRCCVVANGRAYFEEVLKNPAAFPKDLSFEALLDLPERAWFRKTGKEFDYLPKHIFETGFNPHGWGYDYFLRSTDERPRQLSPEPKPASPL